MKNTVKALAAVAALGVSGSVLAGALDATSSDDDLTVEVVVEEAVKLTLSSTADLDFGTYTTAGAAPANDPSVDICVYHRGVTTAGLQFDSANADSGVFNMLGNGAQAQTLSYSVTLDSAGAFVSGTKQTVTADDASASCSGGSNDTVNVDITGDLDAVEAGTYTDTLTITVTPV